MKSPVPGWLPTPSLTALKLAIELNGLAWVPVPLTAGAVVDEPDRLLDVERHRAGAGEVVGIAGDAVEPDVAQRVGEAVGAGEAGGRGIGEAAVGVERHRAALAVAIVPVVTIAVWVAGLAPMVWLKNSVSALAVAWIAVAAPRMPSAALTVKVVLPIDVVAVVERDRRDVDVVAAGLVDQRHAGEDLGELDARGGYRAPAPCCCW